MAIIKLTKDNFEQEVLKADKPVLVDFYADWCGPCQMLSPIVDEVAEEKRRYQSWKDQCGRADGTGSEIWSDDHSYIACDQKRRNHKQTYRSIVQERSD